MSDVMLEKEELPMLRKTLIVISTAAAISGAMALSSTDAYSRDGWGGGVGMARIGGWGWRGPGWGGGVGIGRIGGWGWRSPGWGAVRAARIGGWGWGRPGWGALGAAPILAFGGSCWRSVPTRWGWSRVWAC
jgi:hypothetical protein